MNLSYLSGYQQCLDDNNIRWQLRDSLAYCYGYLQIIDDTTFDVYNNGACVARLSKPRTKLTFRINTTDNSQPLIILEAAEDYEITLLTDIEDNRNDLKAADAELRSYYQKMDKDLFLELFALDVTRNFF